jgi:hypothetical protein
MASRTDRIFAAHLSFAADSTALLELKRCISDAARQLLTTNPPLKPRAAKMTMTIAVIAGLLIICICLLKSLRAGEKKPAQGGPEQKPPAGAGATKNLRNEQKQKNLQERVLGEKIPVQVGPFNHAITKAGNKKPAGSG